MKLDRTDLYVLRAASLQEGAQEGFLGTMTQFKEGPLKRAPGLVGHAQMIRWRTRLFRER